MTILSDRFMTVKNLLNLTDKDELSAFDIVALLGVRLSYVHSVNEFSDYAEMKPVRKGDTFHGGGFKRILLDDYGNGRYRLSCTNEKQHKNMHKQGKCYLSSTWSLEQIELNGYRR